MIKCVVVLLFFGIMLIAISFAVQRINVCNESRQWIILYEFGASKCMSVVRSHSRVFLSYPIAFPPIRACVTLITIYRLCSGLKTIIFTYAFNTELKKCKGATIDLHRLCFLPSIHNSFVVLHSAKWREKAKKKTPAETDQQKMEWTAVDTTRIHKRTHTLFWMQSAKIGGAVGRGESIK